MNAESLNRAPTKKKPGTPKTALVLSRCVYRFVFELLRPQINSTPMSDDDMIVGNCMQHVVCDVNNAS